MKKEARIAALEILYAAEAGNAEPDLSGVSARARRLIDGVNSRRRELDAAINHASKGWRVERMPMVDRCILRLALYELSSTDTPVAVVIDEAVRLAKDYSTARSGGFVNGVLGTLADGTARVEGEAAPEGAEA